MKNTWKTLIASHWKPKMNKCSFFVIFLSGVLFSGILYYLLQHIPQIRMIKQIRHHMPEEHFLQLRDDYSLLATYSSDNYIKNNYLDDDQHISKNSK